MKAMKSPFSAGVHSRPSTVLQFRRNHFSVFAMSVKRSGVTDTAIGAIAWPTVVWPGLRGLVVWHVLHDGRVGAMGVLGQEERFAAVRREPAEGGIGRLCESGVLIEHGLLAGAGKGDPGKAERDDGKDGKAQAAVHEWISFGMAMSAGLNSPVAAS